MRRLLMFITLLLAAKVVFAGPNPNTLPYPLQTALSLNHSNVFFSPQVSSPPIQFQNQGTPLGVSFTFNCSTGMSCSFVNGVMTVTSSGGSGTINSCATTNAVAQYTAATTIGCGNADFTIDATPHTLTGGASGLVDLSAEAATGLTIPKGAGFEPTVDGQIAFNSAQHAYYYGSNGTPLAVASAGTNTTATACTNGGFITISAIAAPTCENKKAFVTGSDYTNATTGATNVTGLSFSLLAGVNYAITCNLIYQGSASTASMILTSTGSASPTEVNAQTIMDTTTGAAAAFYSAATDGTTFGFTLGPTAITTTATDLYATLNVNIINVNSGTWQLQANANGTGTITIRKGSSCTRW